VFNNHFRYKQTANINHFLFLHHSVASAITGRIKLLLLCGLKTKNANNHNNTNNWDLTK